MSQRPLIDHIFLDYGNVCAALDGASFMDGFCEQTGVSQAELTKALYGEVHGYSQLFADYECGEMGPTQFFHRLTTELKCCGKICYDDFARMFVDVFKHNNDLEELLARIRPGKKIYLLSNTNTLVNSRVIACASLIKRHISCQFDRIMSYNVGAIKPHPKIYHAATKRAGAPFENCLFVDDLETNIAAWRSLGGHGIVYNMHVHPIAYLEEQFLKLGLLH